MPAETLEAAATVVEFGASLFSCSSVFGGSIGSMGCKDKPKRSLLGLFNCVCEWDLRMLEVEAPSRSAVARDSLGCKNSKLSIRILTNT